MIFKNLHFLAKAHIRGNKNNIMITFLIILLVISITIVSSLSVVTTEAVNSYKEDYRARSLSLQPYLKPITEEGKKAISTVEHVESIADATGLYGICPFTIEEMDDDFISEEIKTRNTLLSVFGLYGNETKTVIKGETLENSPIYSCLVPSIFYPFDDMDGNDFSKDLEYIDGTTLIGKTLVVNGYNDMVTFPYYEDTGSGECDSRFAELPSPTYKLKVVGTYYCSPETSGYFAALYVSRETDLLMTQTAIEDSGIDLSENEHPIAAWWNTPTTHEYFVVVDDYSNLSVVYNDVQKLGYDISNEPHLLMRDSDILLSKLLSTVGAFLTLSIVFIAIVILVQSSVLSLRAKRGYIGLMKAIGYKNSQMFAVMCWEQLYLTLRAFSIGAVISGAFVSISNYIFSHGTYQQLKYVVDINIYLGFLALSFLIATLVPVICQVILLRKLVKIQPRDAMTTN